MENREEQAKSETIQTRPEADTIHVVSLQQPTVDPQEPPKKKRGRPKKIPISPQFVNTNPNEITVPKKRGRPPKKRLEDGNITVQTTPTQSTGMPSNAPKIFEFRFPYRNQMQGPISSNDAVHSLPDGNATETTHLISQMAENEPRPIEEPRGSSANSASSSWSWRKEDHRRFGEVITSLECAIENLPFPERISGVLKGSFKSESRKCLSQLFEKYGCEIDDLNRSVDEVSSSRKRNL